MITLRKYSELIRLKTFEERYRYLQLRGRVGESTFGFDRIFNQMFYQSSEWNSVRDEIIVRDCGCDLGIKGREINGVILIHHMNPISIDDIRNCTDILLDPEYLISTILSTHNAIHYGNENLLIITPIERRQYDTCPWKH